MHPPPPQIMLPFLNSMFQEELPVTIFVYRGDIVNTLPIARYKPRIYEVIPIRVLLKDDPEPFE